MRRPIGESSSGERQRLLTGNAERRNWRVQNGIAVATGIISLLTALGAGAAAYFARAAYYQSVQQTAAARTEADAVAQQAGSFLTIDHPLNTAGNPDYGGHRLELDLTWTIKNYGASPAIIQGMESHLYLAASEPDPLSAEGYAAREAGAHPADIMPNDTELGGSQNKGDTTPVDNPQSQTVIPPANGGVASVVTAAQRFWFYDLPNVQQSSLTGKEITRNVWFLCLIRYTDQLGTQRVVSIYSQLIGAGSDVAKHQRYTCNSGGCKWASERRTAYLEWPSPESVPPPAAGQ